MTKENKNFDTPTTIELMEMGSDKGNRIAKATLSNFPNFPEGVDLNSAHLHRLSDEDRFKDYCQYKLRFSGALDEVGRIYDCSPEIPVGKPTFLKSYQDGFKRTVGEVWKSEHENARKFSKLGIKEGNEIANLVLDDFPEGVPEYPKDFLSLCHEKFSENKDIGSPQFNNAYFRTTFYNSAKEVWKDKITDQIQKGCDEDEDKDNSVLSGEFGNLH